MDTHKIYGREFAECDMDTMEGNFVRNIQVSDTVRITRTTYGEEFAFGDFFGSPFRYTLYFLKPRRFLWMKSKRCVYVASVFHFKLKTLYGFFYTEADVVDYFQKYLKSNDGWKEN